MLPQALHIDLNMRTVDIRPREFSFDKMITVSTKTMGAHHHERSDSAIDTKFPEPADLVASPIQDEDEAPLDTMTPFHECRTYGDVQDALAMGVLPGRILLTNVSGSPACLRLASKLGVEHVAVDSTEALLKVKSFSPAANIILRVNATGVSSQQSPASHLLAAIQVACDLLEDAAGLGLHVTSVRFHVGTQGTVDTPTSAIEALPQSLDELTQLDQRLPQLLTVYPGLTVSMETASSAPSTHAPNLHEVTWSTGMQAVPVH